MQEARKSFILIKITLKVKVERQMDAFRGRKAKRIKEIEILNRPRPKTENEPFACYFIVMAWPNR
ncbi:hypothetical protein DHX103_11765 [Planococcus sp. X10-3]|uniref:hypothetical protein n=1 Tax=Planococcus sp. X10-3 TaxID=3061240 RepID=UPI003BAE1F58